MINKFRFKTFGIALAFLSVLTPISGAEVTAQTSSYQTTPNDFISKETLISLNLTPYYQGVDFKIADRAFAHQEQEMWCWAASIQMVLRMYRYELSQASIVETVFGQILNQGGTFKQMEYVIDGFLPGYQIDADLISDWDTIHSELNNGRPLIVSLDNPGYNYNHAVVLIGYSYYLDNGYRVITNYHVLDPYPNQPSSLSANEFRQRLEGALRISHY